MSFKVNDQVIKKGEKNKNNYGFVIAVDNMTCPEGKIRVYFQREVLINPDNLVSYEDWLKRHPQVPSVKDLKHYWG